MYYVFSAELMYFTDILHKNKKICQLISGESLIHCANCNRQVRREAEKDWNAGAPARLCVL
jgi:hypothetical protein